MAQYRLSTQTIGRGDGRSAVAAAAYRAGERLTDERLDMSFNYSKRGGVEHSEIMLPEGAPSRLSDRHTLWNEVEKVECRVDARVAREVQVSLPHELTFEQRQELVRDFAQRAFVDRGMIADVAMHTPDEHGDDRNYHAHIMLTTRRIDGDRFGLKEREWNSRETLRDWREQWAEIQNEHLRRHLGRDAPQVSHLSLQDQGIDREATIHLGPTASAIERKGERSERGDINREIDAENSDRMAWKHRRSEIESDLAERSEQIVQTPYELRFELERLERTMREQRDEWRAQATAIEVPRVVRGYEIERGIMSPAKQRLARAEQEMRRTEERVGRIKSRAMKLVSWVNNPQRMIWAKLRQVHALDRARRELAVSKANVRVRKEWLRSDAGRSYVLQQIDESRAKAQPFVSEKRTLERRIARMEKRIAGVGKLREKLHVAEKLRVSGISRPKEVRGPEQLIRHVDASVMRSFRTFTPEQRQHALDLARGLGRGMPFGR